MKTKKFEVDLEKLSKLNLSFVEYSFLLWHKEKMKELDSKMISFNPKEVSEDLRFSESWARSTFKRLIRRGKIRTFKKYFEISIFDYI